MVGNRRLWASARRAQPRRRVWYMRHRRRHRLRHPAKADALLLQPDRRIAQPAPAQIIVEPALGLVQPG